MSQDKNMYLVLEATTCILSCLDEGNFFGMKSPLFLRHPYLFFHHLSLITLSYCCLISTRTIEFLLSQCNAIM